ncbi:MAG TPA: hypothetical protein VMC85_12270 [Desulfomonilaceae bacterium]|nr:hypothetical protein [Desulfomonilaceae bacterium]HVN95130.1 hypothetical protein [Syntrophorhabdaceae bacterium]
MNETPQKTIKAKEFLASFREKPDDFYLLEKYGISLVQLKRVYAALIEKGLLSEYEYYGREKKAPGMEERQRPQLSASTAVGIVEEPSETLTDRILNSGYYLDTRVSKAISDAISTRKRRVSQNIDSEKDEESTMDLCPKCQKPKDPSSPSECPYCGVVFERISPGKKDKEGKSTILAPGDLR